MKFSSIALLVFPIAASANPIVAPDSSVNPSSNEAVHKLMARANNCYLNSDALKNDPQGCDTTPVSGKRKRGVTGGDRFKVSCTAKGSKFGSRGYDKWDYVPAWSCWIWAGWTQEDCECK